jgi:hypothetical protein
LRFTRQSFQAAWIDKVGLAITQQRPQCANPARRFVWAHNSAPPGNVAGLHLSRSAGLRPQFSRVLRQSLRLSTGAAGTLGLMRFFSLNICNPHARRSSIFLAPIVPPGPIILRLVSAKFHAAAFFIRSFPHCLQSRLFALLSRRIFLARVTLPCPTPATLDMRSFHSYANLMEVDLTPDHEAFIRQAISTGRFRR